MVPAMAEAYFQRSPVIFITSASTLKRDGRGGFKEIDHNGSPSQSPSPPYR